MVIPFCILLIVSFFEVRYLFKSDNKKEAVVYFVILGLTIGLAVYLLVAPQYDSFIKIMLGLFGEQQ